MIGGWFFQNWLEPLWQASFRSTALLLLVEFDYDRWLVLSKVVGASFTGELQLHSLAASALV